MADPLQIAQSESGLDMRYAQLGGAYGAGIYFADTSNYSIGYQYNVPGPNHEKQLLLCFVIVGDSFTGGPQSYRVPPNRNDGQPYDSVTNGRHYIVYDNNKQFPCFLVTHK